MQVPKGEEWRNRPRPVATLRVYNMDFFRKIVLRHDTGLGEAYMDKVRVGAGVFAQRYDNMDCCCKIVLCPDTGQGEAYTDKVGVGSGMLAQ